MFTKNNKDNKYINIDSHLDEGGEKLGGTGRRGSYLKSKAGEVDLTGKPWDA